MPILVTSLDSVGVEHSMKQIQIAIDGPASSGKSTVAKIIAKDLDYTYLNTGLCIVQHI